MEKNESDQENMRYGRGQSTDCNLKKLNGHSKSMSSASRLSGRAEAVRQCAIISGHESEPIPFSRLLFAELCRRYLAELVLGSGPGDIVMGSAFQRDSVIQFIAACQVADFLLTALNVFEVELLCDMWEVRGKRIQKAISGMIEHPPNGKSLELSRAALPMVSFGGRDCLLRPDSARSELWTGIGQIDQLPSLEKSRLRRGLPLR
jgi:hypothetical protein